jgi:hypothetical protein
MMLIETLRDATPPAVAHSALCRMSATRKIWTLSNGICEQRTSVRTAFPLDPSVAGSGYSAGGVMKVGSVPLAAIPILPISTSKVVKSM